MSQDGDGHRASKEGDAWEPDESFLLLVDRAMLTSKQLDPTRSEEVHRAVDAETRWANLTHLYALEPRLGHPQDR